MTRTDPSVGPLLSAIPMGRRGRMALNRSEGRRQPRGQRLGVGHRAFLDAPWGEEGPVPRRPNLMARTQRCGSVEQNPTPPPPRIVIDCGKRRDWTPCPVWGVRCVWDVREGRGWGTRGTQAAPRPRPRGPPPGLLRREQTKQRFSGKRRSCRFQPW